MILTTNDGSEYIFTQMKFIDGDNLVTKIRFPKGGKFQDLTQVEVLNECFGAWTGDIRQQNIESHHDNHSHFLGVNWGKLGRWCQQKVRAVDATVHKWNPIFGHDASDRRRLLKRIAHQAESHWQKDS